MSRTRATQQPPTAEPSPLLVGHLMASAPPRSAGANAASTAASITAHALLLALAVWLTTGRTGGTPRPPGIDLVLPVEPAPPPIAPPPVISDPVPIPAGAARGPVFPVLTQPTVIPGEIPEPTAGPITNEGMYTGVGTPVNGEAAAQPGAARPPAEPRPGDFVPITVNPELQNREAIERALQRAYPAMLRDAGITGDVFVWVFVNEEGAVTRTQIKRSSGVAQLDEAALGVAAQMRFSPALNRDVRVQVWVEVPIHFRLGDQDG